MNTPVVQLVATPLQAELSSGLKPIDFADCYQTRIPRAGLDAVQVAQAVFDQPPPGFAALMALRNTLARWAGLKTAAPDSAGKSRIGPFPVVSHSANEVVLGFDDKHLDFRIWVGVEAGEQHADVRVSTLVRFNGLSGRLYLIAVMPFHKMLSRSMLARAGRLLRDRPAAAH